VGQGMGVGGFSGDVSRLILVALAVAIVAAVGAAFAFEFWKPDAELRFLDEGELAFHPSEDEWYSESWNLNYIDEGGLYFNLSVAIGNLGPGDNKANALFIVSTPDGRRGYARTDYFTHPELVAATDRWHVEFGDLRLITVGDVVDVRFRQEEFDLLAQYKRATEPFTLGNGFTFFKRNKYFGEFIHVPVGRVSGVLSFGDETYRLSGFGYSDHQRANVMLNKYYDHYTSFCCYAKKASIHFFENAADNARNAPVQMLYATDGDRVLFCAPKYEFRIVEKKLDESRGFVMPLVVEFEASHGRWSVKGTIENKRLLDEFDLKSQLKPFERLLANLMGKFFVYRWFADATWTVVGPGYEKTFESEAAEFEIGYYR